MEYQSIEMAFFKFIVLFALLIVASAEKLDNFRPVLQTRSSLGFRGLFWTQIVRGREAPKNVYPYIVSLQWGISGSYQHFCAGSILNEEWVVTAGQCILAVPVYGTFLVKAGKHNLRAIEGSEQSIEVQKSFVHENYQGGVGPYDIALIKLKWPFKFSKEVQPVQLPTPESDPTGNAILIGWGSTERGTPDKLQHVDVVYVNRQTCYEAVKRLTGSSPVHETNVCSGPLSSGISACSGDGGGPLVSKVNNKTILNGIVSWGITPCGTVGAPSVYSRMSKFNSWIQRKISSN